MSTLSCGDSSPNMSGVGFWPILRLALALSALGAGVFALPYVVPVSSSVISASSLAGFNNTVAYLAYLVCLVLTGTALTSFLGPRLPDTQPSIEIADAWAPTPVLWAVCAAHVALFAGVFLVKGHVAYADGVYFQQILARMHEGAVPYRDVNFLYGPAMLYPAYWLSRVIPVSLAYLVYYCLMYVFGLYLLYQCIRTVIGAREAAERLFVLFAAGCFNAVLGMNYVLVRFLLPLVTVVIAWRYLNRPSPGRFAVASLALLWTFLYSLEMGVLASGGLLLLGVLSATRPWWMVLLRPMEAPPREAASAGGTTSAASSSSALLHASAVCACAAGGLLMLFYVIDPSFTALARFVTPVLRYSAGGGSRPLSVSLPLVALMLVSILVTAASFHVLSRRGEGTDRLPLLLALLATAIVIQRPSFGKPDVLHIAYSGLPITLLGLAVIPVRWQGLAVRRAYCAVAVVAFMVPLQLYNVLTYAPMPKPRGNPQGGANTPTGSWGARHAVQESLDRLVVRFGTERTYYLHVLAQSSIPVVLHRHLKQVPYLATLDEAFTQDDIQQVIAELRQTRAMVISHRWTLQPFGPVPQDTVKGGLLEFLGVPAPGSKGFAQTVRANDRLREPLLEFLHSAYEVVGEDGDLVVLALRELV